MSGDSYIIYDQNAPHFLTCSVVDWIDLFTRKEYRNVIVDSFNYCIEHKNIDLFAWVIMSNHIHFVVQVNPPGTLSSFLRDFKKFTSKRLIDKINEINESRTELLLDKFSFTARKTRRANNYKIWSDGNHAMNLSHIDIMQKIDYIHDNPVKAGIVHYPDQYIYSSAIDYARGKGLVKVIVI